MFNGAFYFLSSSHTPLIGLLIFFPPLSKAPGLFFPLSAPLSSVFAVCSLHSPTVQILSSVSKWWHKGAGQSMTEWRRDGRRGKRWGTQMDESGRVRGNMGRTADSWQGKDKSVWQRRGEIYINIYFISVFISVRAPFSDKDAALMVHWRISLSLSVTDSINTWCYSLPSIRDTSPGVKATRALISHCHTTGDVCHFLTSPGGRNWQYVSPFMPGSFWTILYLMFNVSFLEESDIFCSFDRAV